MIYAKDSKKAGSGIIDVLDEDGKVVMLDALSVDREDGEKAQVFTRAEIESIKANTLAHEAALKATKSPGDEEYDYYLAAGDSGKSRCESACDDVDALIAECEKLNIKIPA